MRGIAMRQAGSAADKLVSDRMSSQRLSGKRPVMLTR
jgi:hypothetical protein